MEKADYVEGDNQTSSNTIHEPSNLLDRKAAAKFLGVKEHTLAVWLSTNRYHLPYVKVGRLVKYRLSDLEKFLEENLHRQL